MAELTPDRRLLEHLNQFGIGNYQRIDKYLLELFPGEKNAEDFKNVNIKGAILSFTTEMITHKFIKTRGIRDEDYLLLEACIQPEGVRYLSEINRGGSSVINVSGSHNQVIGQSSEYLNSFLNVQTSPTTHTTTKTNDRKPKIRRIIEMAAWIVGILIGLIGIWQFVFPNVFKSPKTQQIDSTKNIFTDSINKPTSTNSIKRPLSNKKTKENIADKNDLNSTVYIIDSSILNLPFNNTFSSFHFLDTSIVKVSARHVTQEDIQKILDFMPSKNSPIWIHFKRDDQESQNFANEIANNLKSYIVTILPLPAPYFSQSGIVERFSLKKGLMVGDNSLTISINSLF